MITKYKGERLNDNNMVIGWLSIRGENDATISGDGVYLDSIRMQTGAKDKDGRPIFDRDLLQFNENTYKVIWENYGFKLELLKGSGNKLISLNHSSFMTLVDD